MKPTQSNKTAIAIIAGLFFIFGFTFINYKTHQRDINKLLVVCKIYHDILYQLQWYPLQHR